MTGITRCSAAKAIQKVLGGSIDHVGGSYDKPALADMIIVPVEKFLKMAEVISESVLNDRRERFRQTYLHNDDGYYEDVSDSDDEIRSPLKIEGMPRDPVADAAEANMIRECLLAAIDCLSEPAKRRLYAYYFMGLTYREIAAQEGVGDKTIRQSIGGAIKKMKKFL